MNVSTVAPLPCLDAGRRNTRTRLIAADDRDIPTKRGQRFCCSEADAVGGAGDQDLFGHGMGGPIYDLTVLLLRRER